MIDYYLRFTDAKEAETVLSTVMGEVDIIGDVPEKQGWYVNLRCQEPQDGLDTYIINDDETKYRVWA